MSGCFWEGRTCCCQKEFCVWRSRQEGHPHLYISLSFFFFFPTSEVQVRFELPAGLFPASPWGSLAGLREYLDIKPEYQILCVLAKNSVCKQKTEGTCSHKSICVLLLFRNVLEFQRSDFFLTSTYYSIYLDISSCGATRPIIFFIWFWRILLLASFLKEEKRGKKEEGLGVTDNYSLSISVQIIQTILTEKPSCSQVLARSIFLAET